MGWHSLWANSLRPPPWPLISHQIWVIIEERNGNPLQYSCLENPMDRGAWQATVHGVARVRYDLAAKPPPPCCVCIYTYIYTYICTRTHIYIPLCSVCLNFCPFLIGLCLSQLGFPGSSDGKASAYNAGDPGSIPGSGRSPGEGNGNPLQDSCLENPTDWGAW